MKKLVAILLLLVLNAFLPPSLFACAPKEIHALRSAHRAVAGEILSVERVGREETSVIYSLEVAVREVLVGASMEEDSIRVRMRLWNPTEDPSYEKGKSYVLYLRKEPEDPKAGGKIAWSVKYGARSIQPDTEKLREMLGSNRSKKDRSYKASQDGVDVDKLTFLERKMHGIIIPEMDFMCANIHDVIDFLHMASIDFDRSSPAGQKGVNICLNGRSFAGGRMPLVNFYAEDMSLLQALNLVVKLADGERIVTDDGIVVRKRSADPSSTGPIAPASPSTETESAEPVVGHLKTRDKVITIRTGAAGPLYTVTSENGTVLATDLSPAELSARFPDLERVVKSGIADWAGTTGHMSIEIPR